jgi:hypothetical protein
VNDNRPKGGSPTMSWLVRCWEEPRELAQAEPVLRCFVRDLRTGEERYLTDPREIGELVLRQLRSMSGGAGRNEPAGLESWDDPQDRDHG